MSTSPSPAGESNQSSSLAVQLGVITFTRTVVYTGMRMVFPFLPVLARGMGVSLETAALAITLRSAMGMLSPLLGPLGDVHGRKWAQRLGLMLLGCGALLPGLFPSYSTFLVGSLLFGLGIVIFDPSIQAYVGDRVPYQRRATAMAVVELGWSAAFLIGIPLVGRVISEERWGVPFLGVAGLILVSLLLVHRVLPESSRTPGERPDLAGGLKTAVRHRPSMAAVLVSFLMLTGSRALMIVYGAWFEDVFNLNERMLGDVSSSIGAAGIAGLLVVVLITDRIGKKPALGWGLLVSALAALGLPFFKESLGLTVGTLVLYYIAFEFALVTGISLVSELRPGARATLMAFNAAALSAGDALGSFLGPWAYSGSITPNVALVLGCNLAAGVVLVLFVRVGDR